MLDSVQPHSVRKSGTVAKGKEGIGAWVSFDRFPRSQERKPDTEEKREEGDEGENNHFGAGRKKERRVTVIAARKKISERGERGCCETELHGSENYSFFPPSTRSLLSTFERAPPVRSTEGDLQIILELIFDSFEAKKSEVHPDFDFRPPRCVKSHLEHDITREWTRVGTTVRQGKA